MQLPPSSWRYSFITTRSIANTPSWTSRCAAPCMHRASLTHIKEVNFGRTETRSIISDANSKVWAP